MEDIKENSPEQKIKKTADINKYMSDYMKNKYSEDPIKMRNYKNSLNIKKKYIIDDAVWNEYKEQLANIVHLKEIVDQLPSGTFEKFLMNYKTLNFQRKIVLKENENL